MNSCPVLELIRGETGIAGCLKAERDGALKPSYRKLICGGWRRGGDVVPNLTAMEIGGKDYCCARRVTFFSLILNSELPNIRATVITS